MIVKNILICEDIRREVGNKLSLMGILGGSLNIDIQPDAPKEMLVAVSLAFLVCIENTNPANDPKNFNVKMTMSNGDIKLADMTARIESTGADRIIHLPVPRVEFGFQENAKLSIHAQIMENDTLVSEHTAILDINLNRNTEQSNA